MRLHELSPLSRVKKSKKRLGRGTSSGVGKTCGKGHKGQKARSGGSIRPGFEGGQTPLQRRVPKRGFKNKFASRYAIVNVGKLDRFEDGSVVNADTLIECGLIKKKYDGLKILGNGELNKKLDVFAVKFSKSAKEKIEKARGKVELV